MYDFINREREIIIDQYNTPTPWMNYLSNGTFHTMISQAGGGVAFYKSPQIWRINHYRFFHLPTDRSGFYTYIKDGEDIWCPTSEPCKNKPDTWKAAHGMGYTRYTAEKNGVEVVKDTIVETTSDHTLYVRWKAEKYNKSSKSAHNILRHPGQSILIFKSSLDKLLIFFSFCFKKVEEEQ